MTPSIRSWVLATLLCACCGGASETAAPPAAPSATPPTNDNGSREGEPATPPAPVEADGGTATPTPPAGQVRSQLGARALAILEGATSVEVAQLDHRDTRAADARGSWPPNRMAVFRIRGTLAPVDAALGSRLLAIVLDDASYDWQTRRRCARRDLVGFRFHQGEERADVVLGRSCEQVEITATAADGASLVDWAGWYTPARDRIEALVQEALGTAPPGR